MRSQLSLAFAFALAQLGACTSADPGADADTSTDTGSSTGASESESESGPAGECVTEDDCPYPWICELGECVPGAESTTGVPTDTGDAECTYFDECPDGLLCVEGECTSVAAPPSCAAPTLVALELPSQNGLVVAIDVVDLDDDGDDDVLAWIEGVGIGVLDLELGQWQMSEFGKPVDTSVPRLVAFPVDADANFDVLVNNVGSSLQVGLGDGTGSFAFANVLSGLYSLQRVSFADGDHRLFGSNDGVAELRVLDETSTSIKEVPGEGRVIRAAQFDGEDGEELLTFFWCRAWALRHTSGSSYSTTEIQLYSQGLPGQCRWFAADLDGDGRDELIARETLYWSASSFGSYLSVFPGQSEPFAPPSFGPPSTALVPEVYGTFGSGYGAELVADLDGDGDDELILTARYEPGGAMLSASDEALLGCWTTGLPLPDRIIDGRAADLDADGDDELVVLRDNGALHIYDAQ